MAIDDDPFKATLHRYLQVGRDAMVWKLDGLDEAAVRRPLTPTGTNLLGLVKHLALVEFGYFGDTFGRPPTVELPEDHDDPHDDLVATADESTESIVELYRAAWRHSDATIAELALDAEGTVPWWGDRGTVDLHLVLVHVATETHRHAGHADIVRELIDGAVGHREDVSNLPDYTDAEWEAHRAGVARLAEGFE